MAIKDPLMFITIEEFKNWKGFNKLEFDDTTTPDNEIWFSISVASNNIDYLSGYSISKKWPETKLTEFTDIVQTATAYYVRFLLTKDSNYIRGQSSISQGGMTYSENNPNEPYYIVPEVFNCLRKIKEYPNITGFNLDVLPKRNDFFSNFYSNCGEDSALTRYLELINLKSKDPRTKITLENPKDLIGTELWIDTTGIKTDTGNSLWEVNKDNPNFIAPKDNKGISANDKKIIDVGAPTFLTDGTNKEYVDNKIPDLTNYYKKEETNDLLDKKIDDEQISYILQLYNNKYQLLPDAKIIGGSSLLDKQDKLTAGTNITIENNVISATGGGVDPNNYYTKPEVDKKLEDKVDIDKFSYAFTINALGTENPNLETTNKTIVGAINENKSSIDKKQDKLTAGTNITIENNVISATGGSTDLSDYYKKEETNNLLDKKIDDEQIDDVFKIYGNKYQLKLDAKIYDGGTLLDKQNKKDETLNTNDKNIVGAINELDKKIDKWNQVGTLSDDNLKITYDLKKDTLYRVGYSWDNAKVEASIKYVEFTFRGNSMPLDINFDNFSKINNYSQIQCETNGITITKINYDWGLLFTLEEKEMPSTYKITSNTLKIIKSDKMNILRPLDILSETLKINKLKENTYQIDLKENPTPCTCQKWKEVGNKKNIKTIEYNFISKKRYRVYYSFLKSNDPDDFSYSIKEFIYGGNIGRQYLEEWQDFDKNIMYLQLYKNTISIFNSDIRGKILKLEEENLIIPTPIKDNWKEVGTVGKNQWGNWTITYKFKDNKKYRVFYNWGEYDYIKIIKEFIFNLPITTNEITSFEDGNNHQVLTLRNGNDITIYSIKGKSKGKLWKLQELQE